MSSPVAIGAAASHRYDVRQVPGRGHEQADHGRRDEQAQVPAGDVQSERRTAHLLGEDARQERRRRRVIAARDQSE
jgi:hypothetical protein